MDLSFELRDFAMDHYQRVAGMRWLMGGLGILWGAFLVGFIMIQLSLRTFDSTQSAVFLVVYTGLCFALATSVWAVWMARLGPVALTINEGGLEFGMDSGRTELLSWNEMSKGVALVDYTVNPSLVKFSRRLWQLRRWNRPPTDLTEEAFDAIVTTAVSRGFSVTSSFSRHSRWGRCRTVRFSLTSVAGGAS